MCAVCTSDGNSSVGGERGPEIGWEKLFRMLSRGFCTLCRTYHLFLVRRRTDEG
jgi:hypothetical protein